MAVTDSDQRCEVITYKDSSRTGVDGELKTTAAVFHFEGILPEVQQTVTCKVRCISMHQNEATLNGVTPPQNQDCRMTNAILDKLLEDTILHKRKLRQLLKKFEKVFAYSDNDIGRYDSTVSISLRDPYINPKYCKPRIVPYALREWADEKLKDMCKAGLIQLSTGSPFNSPVHIVKKKCGKPRLTIDYRWVNSVVKQNRWPIPNIRELLENLAGAKVFSVLDARSGFWQLRLDPKCREVTAFTCRGRQYVWNVLPMGLSTSPSIYQKVMMDILGDLVHKNVMIYIDDLCLYSEDVDSHYKILKKVFERLMDAGIKLHPDKSKIGQKSVTYLGYEVGAFGFRPIKSKVKAILEMSRPTTKTELKSFVGGISFYTSSIPRLQHTLAPLHEISGSKAKFNWGPPQEEAFAKAKELLASCGSLAFPSRCDDNTLILTTDASNTGFGGVLTEKDKDGKEKPLGYYSGTFRDSQVNWPIREKELYALFYGLEHFYPQLCGTIFVWRTDNKSLSTLSDASLRLKPSGVPNSRLIRWLEYISNFSFSTEHHKGDTGPMNLADCLSRMNKPKTNDSTPTSDNPEYRLDTLENTDKIIASLNILQLPYWTKTGIPTIDFVQAQIKDTDLMKGTGIWARYKPKREKLSNERRKGAHRQYERKVLDGVHCIYNHGWMAMVPDTLVQEVFDFYHGPSHQSARRMALELKKNLFVPNLMRRLARFTNQCPVCASVWSRPHLVNEPIKTTTAVHPWAWAQIDLIGPLPRTLDSNQYILTYVDQFSRWTELRALQDKTADNVVKALDDIFTVRGPPLNVQSDNGREFINETVQNYLFDLGIKHTPIAPYHPESNGLVERTNRKVKQQLQLQQVEDLVWDQFLPSLQLGLNMMRLSDGSSPFLRLHGWTLYRPAYLAADFDENSHQNHLKSENQWCKEHVRRMARMITDQYLNEEESKLSNLMDTKGKVKNLKIGLKVLVYFPHHHGKLFSNWKGIYIINEILDKNTVIVAEQHQLRKKYVVDRKRLRLLDMTQEIINNQNDGDITEKVQNFEEANLDMPQVDETSNEELDCTSENTQTTNDDTRNDAAVVNQSTSRTTEHECIEETERKSPYTPSKPDLENEEPHLDSTGMKGDNNDSVAWPTRSRRKAKLEAQTKIKGWTKALRK